MKKYFRALVLGLLLLACEIGQAGSNSQSIADAILAGEGSKSVAFNQQGELSLLYWKVVYGNPNPADDFFDDPTGDFFQQHYFTQLIFATQAVDGQFKEEVVATSEEVGWQQHYGGFTHAVEVRDYTNASLVFDSHNQAHMLAYDGYDIVRFSRVNGVWQKVESTVIPCCSGNERENYMAVEIDQHDALHVLINHNASLYYATNKSGEWQWEIAATDFNFVQHYYPKGELVDEDGNLYQMSYLPRFVSLAIDQDGFAHIGYCPAFKQYYYDGGPTRSTSQYQYASNRTGEWLTEVISLPANTSSDAGYGGSVAINPVTQKPAIATFYVSRAKTGSAKAAKLLFHEKLNDRWVTKTIASKANGYLAKDGNKGTGFAPLLKFDDQGKPVVAFSDFASQHFSFGADEFAGQIRSAQKNRQGKWVIKTLYAQRKPLLNQVIYPSMAMKGSRQVFVSTVQKSKLKGISVINTDYQVVVIDQTQSSK